MNDRDMTASRYLWNGTGLTKSMYAEKLISACTDVINDFTEHPAKYIDRLFQTDVHSLAMYLQLNDDDLDALFCRGYYFPYVKYAIKREIETPCRIIKERNLRNFSNATDLLEQVKPGSAQIKASVIRTEKAEIVSITKLMYLNSDWNIKRILNQLLGWGTCSSASTCTNETARFLNMLDNRRFFISQIETLDMNIWYLYNIHARINDNRIIFGLFDQFHIFRS